VRIRKPRQSATFTVGYTDGDASHANCLASLILLAVAPRTLGFASGHAGIQAVVVTVPVRRSSWMAIEIAGALEDGMMRSNH
jgi:hypothetical protein